MNSLLCVDLVKFTKKLEVLGFVHNILQSLCLLRTAHCSSQLPSTRQPWSHQSKQKKSSPQLWHLSRASQAPSSSSQHPSGTDHGNVTLLQRGQEPDRAVTRQRQEPASGRQISGTRTGREGDFQAAGKGELQLEKAKGSLDTQTLSECARVFTWASGAATHSLPQCALHRGVVFSKFVLFCGSSWNLAVGDWRSIQAYDRDKLKWPK